MSIGFRSEGKNKRNVCLSYPREEMNIEVENSESKGKH